MGNTCSSLYFQQRGLDEAEVNGAKLPSHKCREILSRALLSGFAILITKDRSGVPNSPYTLHWKQMVFSKRDHNKPSIASPSPGLMRERGPSDEYNISWEDSNVNSKAWEQQPSIMEITKRKDVVETQVRRQVIFVVIVWVLTVVDRYWANVHLGYP